ncbi:MAG: plastocyanin/azurin family copper-binding protein, partial [Actinomycetota bacterium]|nr:plastocyanin/azurin family copper-binding protein [Actinomycetota bacterium]
AAGGGCHVAAGEVTGSSKTDVAIGKCAFRDTVTYVEPGDRVTWTNKDPVPHTVTGAMYSWGDEEILSRGDKVAYTFEEEGVYPYYCALHPAMVGVVVVGDAQAMLDGAAGPVVKAGLAAAAASDEAPRSGSDGTSVFPAAAITVAVAAAALSLWLVLKRRAGAASPA